MSNHHLFANYCQLYQRLCKESYLVAKPCKMMSDRQLLEAINNMLVLLNCIPMTADELETELN